jgi:hypothetical protein
MSNNASQVVEDIKFALFDDRDFEISLRFATWTGCGNSFIVKDEDGQEYRVTVTKEWQ